MEEEEGTRKRQGTECEWDVVIPVASKKPRNPARTNEVDEKEEQDVMPWLTLDDDTVMELSELLDSSEASSSSSSFSSAQQFNFKVKFIEDPYMSPAIFQSSSAYVTINGNEESCGSSFSDSDSTLMASVDMGSFWGALRKLSRELNEDGGGPWISDATEEEVVSVSRGWMEGNDYVKGVFVNH